MADLKIEARRTSFKRSSGTQLLLAIFQLCASMGWLAAPVLAKSSVKGCGLTATDGKGGSSADPALYNSP